MLPNRRVCPIRSVVLLFLLFSSSRSLSPTFLQSQTGRTGVVFNVAPRALGIITHKVVGNRYMEKRLNIRIEHVRHSKCREDFIRRVKANAAAKKDAKATGEQVNVKRVPALPRTSRTISVGKENAIETLRPIAYDTVRYNLESALYHVDLKLMRGSFHSTSKCHPFGSALCTPLPVLEASTNHGRQLRRTLILEAICYRLLKCSNENRVLHQEPRRRFILPIGGDCIASA